jgi:hypothetical protein
MTAELARQLARESYIRAAAPLIALIKGRAEEGKYSLVVKRSEVLDGAREGLEDLGYKVTPTDSRGLTDHFGGHFLITW